ncbi:MAG: DUF423 domain-containing protein [Gemmatimonadetes bacterium]|nr:DUF423 domain-containing protein [Gemmatimonadota bacterium]
MSRQILRLGALLAALGVAAGAFGAHALRARVDAAGLATFETAVRYQMYHAFALLVVGWQAARAPSRAAWWAAVCFAAGVVLFSGSLYVLVLAGIPWLGAITPLGGVAFLGGWGCLAVAFGRPASPTG